LNYIKYFQNIINLSKLVSLFDEPDDLYSNIQRECLELFPGNYKLIIGDSNLRDSNLRDSNFEYFDLHMNAQIEWTKLFPETCILMIEESSIGHVRIKLLFNSIEEQTEWQLKYS
jgi:hypothetical protein